MPFVSQQVNNTAIVGDILYTIGAVSVIFVVLALGFVDTGLVRRKNVLDTWIQKIVAGLIAGGGTLVFGYAIWEWQFNQAFAVPNPLGQAIKDWWIGGQFQTHFAGALDPKVLPEADVQQIFLVFFITFSIGTLALIHTGTMERMKPAPLYVMAAVIGLILSPLVAYYCWGPVGPLTNNGTHDFDGIFPLYIFGGTWVAVLAWRLGPRLGAFKPHPSGTVPAPQNLGLVAVGVLFIMLALPFIALASGFLFPGAGFFGISFTNSGWGIVLVNVFTAYIGGAITGTIIAYWRREPFWALLGPIAGAVICGTLFDIGFPWEVLVVSLFGAPVALLTYLALPRLGIDEPKIIPLALGPGIVGAIATGFIKWGTHTGGYPGLKGTFALQHATITPGYQLLGVLVTMALAAIPCLLICLVFERTSGLRVSEAEELAGLDWTNWGVTNYGTETIYDGSHPTLGGEPPVAAPAPRAPEGAAPQAGP